MHAVMDTHTIVISLFIWGDFWDTVVPEASKIL